LKRKAAQQKILAGNITAEDDLPDAGLSQFSNETVTYRAGCAPQTGKHN